MGCKKTDFVKNPKMVYGFRFNRARCENGIDGSKIILLRNIIKQK